MQVAWVLESEVFPQSHVSLGQAINSAGHQLVRWKDEWWSNQQYPTFDNSPVVFHGSLGNAAQIHKITSWRPGAYCDRSAFQCSAWYPRASEWLIHRQWRILPANALAADPCRELEEWAHPGTVFVRPDSPLKPFSGRVLALKDLSLEALDFGFYYDDPALPVVVAPVRQVEREWRYVVVRQHIVSGSRYAADGRTPLPDDPGGLPWSLASEIAIRLTPPDEVYVMDICEADGELKLLELNPFSGADLYACPAEPIVAAVSEAAYQCFCSERGRLNP